MTETNPSPARGAGLPLLLLHAFPLNARMWEAQAATLPPRVRVLAPDLPGFGADAAGTAYSSLDDCAAWIERLLDAEGVDRCIAGGCSMGGYIALALLRRAPARVAGLVLANTRAGADTAEARASRLAQAADVRARGMGAVIDALLPKLLAPENAARRPELASAVRAMMEAAPPESAARMLEAMAARADSFDALAAFRGPALLLVGESDALTPPDEARRMAGALRGAELHVLPACGHLSNLEQGDAFDRLVLDFCARAGA
jgi:pimeloyl-ACP methyl ester carboxylesterase